MYLGHRYDQLTDSETQETDATNDTSASKTLNTLVELMASSDNTEEVEEPEAKDTVSKDDYLKLQDQIVEIQKQSKKDKDAADTVIRTNLMSELKTLNPSLAKINKDSNMETLQIVVETTKQFSTGFPSLKEGKDKETKADAGNHTIQHYDFVKKEFVYT